MGKETACCTLCGLRQACPAIGIFIGIENSAVYMMGILVNSRARLRNSPPPPPPQGRVLECAVGSRLQSGTVSILKLWHSGGHYSNYANKLDVQLL